MKKFLLKIIKTIFIMSIVFWSFTLLIPVTKAQEGTGADGCCTMTCGTTPSNSTSMKESGCIAQFTREDGVICKGVFSPNQQASLDGTRCINSSDALGSSLPKFSNPLDNPKLSVSIPGFLGFRSIECESTSSGEAVGEKCVIPWLADYMQAIYRYGIGAILILAVVVMMIGGVVWLTASGNDKKISDAKNWINGSLFGILIALSSYMILNIINPALTTLSPLKLSSIGQEDLLEMDLEVDDLSTGARDTTDCPGSATTIESLAQFYTKTKVFQYSQAKRGTCEGETCYCDCSWFADHIGRCAGLNGVGGEGTSAGLFGNSKKVKITQNDCNNSPLKAGDIIVWRNKENTKGHVLTYIGNNKMIECGGGTFGSSIIERSGKVYITDWKSRCSNYLINRGAYYIKR